MIYDSESVVDIAQIQRRLAQSNSTNGIVMQRDAEAQVITIIFNVINSFMDLTKFQYKFSGDY